MALLKSATCIFEYKAMLCWGKFRSDNILISPCLNGVNVSQDKKLRANDQPVLCHQRIAVLIPK